MSDPASRFPEHTEKLLVDLVEYADVLDSSLSYALSQPDRSVMFGSHEVSTYERGKDRGRAVAMCLIRTVVGDARKLADMELLTNQSSGITDSNGHILILGHLMSELVRASTEMIASQDRGHQDRATARAETLGMTVGFANVSYEVGRIVGVQMQNMDRWSVEARAVEAKSGHSYEAAAGSFKAFLREQGVTEPLPGEPNRTV